jgi:predicted murein hydrolase (TIGR00659 family)
MNPWLWLPATVLVYESLRRAYAARPRIYLVPVLGATVAIGAACLLFDIDLDVYARGTSPLVWLLGPATVGLAVPLVRERALLLRHVRAIGAGVVGGSVASLVSAVLLARVLHLAPVLIRSVAPKSVTTPVAMPISARLGGSPEVTAAVVIATGLFGMAFGPALLSRAGVDSKVARGIGLGTAAHGIGTAAAMQESAVTGAAAAVAIVLAAITTALVAGPLLALIG